MMKATTETVPRLVQFENNQDNYERLDEIQALNTALCFLCSINADVAEVESFLWSHPEALLLEGASRLAEESARYILQTRSCDCSEQSSCKRNRNAILQECLSQDFIYYLRRHQQQQRDAPDSKSAYTAEWSDFRQDLLLIEQDIRHWRREEWELRQELLELTLQEEMEAMQEKDTSPLRWVMCTVKRVDEEQQREERQARIRVFQDRHRALLLDIRRARQVQFRLLKQTFSGVRRHVCLNKLFPKG